MQSSFLLSTPRHGRSRAAIVLGNASGRRMLFENARGLLQSQAEKAYNAVTAVQAATGQHKKELSWTEAVVDAKRVVQAPHTLLNAKAVLSWRMIRTALSHGRHVASTGHPLLPVFRDCLLERNGHNVRPLIVLLTAKSVVSFLPDALAEEAHSTTEGVLPSQKALAEITEMIHVASLIHEGVVDISQDSAPSPAPDIIYGNKLSVLTGDYLLTKASVKLAGLHNVPTVREISLAIADFVDGLTMKRCPTLPPEGSADSWVEDQMDLRTASLLARSCRSVCLLGEVAKEVEELAYLIGRHIGIAYQLTQDVDVYRKALSQSQSLLPPLSRPPPLFLAPTAYALHSHGQTVLDLMRDPSCTVREINQQVVECHGVEQSLALAQVNSRAALSALSQLPPNQARSALMNMASTLGRCS